MDRYKRDAIWEGKHGPTGQLAAIVIKSLFFSKSLTTSDERGQSVRTRGGNLLADGFTDSSRGHHTLVKSLGVVAQG